jgi:hypothetical protein
MEWIGFSPSPSVDLFWHSHLLQPAAYFRDAFELCGCVSHHKLLPSGAQTEFVYDAHSSAEAQLWEEEFHEPMSVLLLNKPARPLLPKNVVPTKKFIPNLK